MSCRIQNTGKTPAFLEDVEACVGSFVLPSDSVRWLYTNHLGDFTIPPNGKTALVMVEPEPISEADFQLLEAGTLSHCFRVRIRYRDISGIPRFTEFGYVVSGRYEYMIHPNVFPAWGKSRME